MVYDTKIVTVGYGWIRNNPNRRAIEKRCRKMGVKGYRLQSRIEHKTGCLKMMFTALLARGKTELTFVREGTDVYD